jgi:hypothetical protein
VPFLARTACFSQFRRRLQGCAPVSAPVPVARTEGDAEHGKLVDLSAFQRDILPLIQDVPLSQLQRATGLSLRYVSLIRRGERTPHPQHWSAFLGAAEA